MMSTVLIISWIILIGASLKVAELLLKKSGSL